MLRRLAAGGSTPLYDALYMALKEFGTLKGTDEFSRRALVVLSDGDDTASLLPFGAVLEQARRSNVAIYPISIASRNPVEARLVSGDDYDLRSLAVQTGARSFFPTSLRDLEGVYESITGELAQQYAIAFMPARPGRAGEFRRLAVMVDAPSIRVRTRAGCIAGD